MSELKDRMLLFENWEKELRSRDSYDGLEAFYEMKDELATEALRK